MSAENTMVSEQPKQTDGRRGDAVILVQQNNADKALVISGMNGVAQTLLGYEREDVTGRRLEVILGQRTGQQLADDLEYEDDAPDLGDILARQHEIRLRPRMGDEMTVVCTVSRLMSDGMNARFQLVIPNEKEVRAGQKIRDFIALNLEGRAQLDASTGLPNRQTAVEFIPLLKNYLPDSGIDAVFAVIRLDRHKKSLAKYGAPACVTLLQHVVNCCRSTFRTEDMIFVLSDHALGIILFDISRESARVVFNRLRWNIRNHRIEFGGKADFSITACVSFDMLTGESEKLLERCEEVVAAHDPEIRNGLIELGN